jgi:hypothetical protein
LVEEIFALTGIDYVTADRRHITAQSQFLLYSHSDPITCQFIHCNVDGDNPSTVFGKQFHRGIADASRRCCAHNDTGLALQ